MSPSRVSRLSLACIAAVALAAAPARAAEPEGDWRAAA
jgi:hypothetical protein